MSEVEGKCRGWLQGQLWAVKGALVAQQALITQNAVEGGAADAELASGAELVATIQVEYVLDVMVNDIVEAKIVEADGRLEAGLGLDIGWQGKVADTNDAVVGFKQGGLKDACELAHVSRPVVLEQAGERAGAEHGGALLVAVAESVKQGLGERSHIFSALAQGRDGEADGGEAEGEVREKQALAGHLSQRSLRGGEEDGAASRPVLQCLEDAEQEPLPGRG